MLKRGKLPLLRPCRTSVDAMIHVCLTSGVEVAAVLVDDVDDVLTLKRHVQATHGISRFRQRMALEGRDLHDGEKLAGSDVQLVLLSHAGTSMEQVQQLLGAARLGDFMDVEEILGRPQDPNLTVDVRLPPTALGLATQGAHVEVVRMLLEANADTNRAGTFRSSCQTPVGLAARTGQVEILRILLEARARVDRLCTTRGRSETPLCMAACRGHVATVRLLRDARADVNKTGPHSGTPLLAASRNGHKAVVHLLLDVRADTERICHDSSVTALVAASDRGRVEIVRMLLGAGARVDRPGALGTPLAAAARKGHQGVVRQLLRAGADPDLQYGPMGETALDVAIRWKKQDVVDMLLQASSGAGTMCQNEGVFPSLVPREPAARCAASLEAQGT